MEQHLPYKPKQGLKFPNKAKTYSGLNIRAYLQDAAKPKAKLVAAGCAIRCPSFSICPLPDD